MILGIILLILIILIVAIILMFLFYILFPSIKKDHVEVKEDAVISDSEKNYIKGDIDVFEASDKKAVVLCACDKEFKNKRENFNHEYTCFMVNSLNDSGTDCKFACIGLGDCAKVCEQQAIDIKNRTAVISSLCIGCGKCIEVCPKKIIKLVDKSTSVITQCSNVKDSLTTCSNNQAEKKLEWITKKDFKLWSYCYKIFRKVLTK